MLDERVIVTGGAGFIGSHLVDSLVGAGARVTVLDNLLTGHRENVHRDADFKQLDIRDREAILSVFREVRPRLVFHLAAQSSVKVSVDDPHLDVEVNVLGGVNVLDGARVGGAERVMFSSTGGALYGEVPEGQLADETWPAKPVSPYAASKAGFEYVLASYRECYGLESTVLRFANVYGPRQDPHGEAGVVAIFCGRLLSGAPLTVFARREPGDGGCVRDYVYVSDVVSACRVAAELPPATYNVGTGVGATTEEILAKIAEACRIKPAPSQSGRRPGDLERSVLDPRRLMSAGWAPGVQLSDGIACTQTWFAAQG